MNYVSDYRCAAYMSFGAIKHLATPTTMNVPDITSLYESLRTVIKHFECSVKNKELLDYATEIFALFLLSSHQTRIFLKHAKALMKYFHLTMKLCTERNLLFFS